MSIIGKVTEIDGKFYAVSVDGYQRELRSGDDVFDGEKILGDVNNRPYESAVINFNNGKNSIVVLGDSEERMNFLQNFSEEPTQEIAEQPKDEIASLLEEEDVEDLETAAGEEGSPSAESTEGGPANFAEANGGITDINADLRDIEFNDTQENNFRVLDINEDVYENNKPIFTPVNPGDSEYTFSYSENTDAGATIATVAATDLDGDTITYSIKTNETNQAGDALFAIDATTGEISLTAAGEASFADDYELGDNLNDIIVTASDGVHNTDINVNLNETNLNDNGPIFTPVNPGDSEYTFSYSENTDAGATIATVAATDLDGDTITYSIKTNETNQAGDALFAIDATTGEISLTAAGEASFADDYELGDNLNDIIVTASDGVHNTDINVNLNETNLNDNGPIFTPVNPGDSEYTFSYSENTDAGATIATVAATDLDGDTITYSIKTNETNQAGDALFAIDATTGEISLTAAGEASFADDYELGDNLNDIIVTASDGVHNTDINVNLNETNLNDNGPIFTPVNPGDSEYTFSYSENTDAGATIATVAATDLDGDTITYSIKTNETNQAGDALFAIDATTGEISLTAAGEASFADDYELGDNLNDIIVTASDGVHNTDINVNLNETNLNDNGPIFTPVNPGDSEYTFSYSENTDAGATIATVAATDLDGDTITYSIKTNETNQAGDALFAIDATTGEISLTAAGEASFADDYELGDNLNDIIVTASDGVHNTDINVNLNETNLNDNGPIFTPVNPGDSEYTFSYSENTDAGATIATVAATDLDGDTITYSIKTNETNQAGDALFAIDATTGEISLTAAGEASFADDYELGDNLNDIIVTASDGVHNTDINVNLNETNLNDNGPIFTPVNPGDSEYTFSYSENTDAGATIATVAATDLDGDTITYSIKTNETNQAGDALFAIDATTGEISLTAAGEASFADDYELGDNLNDIIVTASDGVHNTDINVNLNETNLNDNGPIFTPVNPGDSEYTFSYSENTDAGATIATVAATDLDGDTITYSIKTNETNQAGDALFAIDATTGEISLTAAGEASFADDYELGDNLNDIIVTASDGVHNTDINVNLNETNLNDNGPIFTPVNPGDSEYTFSYSENTDAGATIATVAATDLDGDTITYSIKTNETNQAGDALFAIDATTGEISLTAAGEASFADDYELGDNLNDIIVTASDGVHNTDINVNLNETNLNDNGPIFTPVNPGDSEYTFSYSENTDAGATIATVAATDLDGDTITYSIKTNETNQAGDALFAIDATTGEISLTAAGEASFADDYELGDNLNDIIVTASDGVHNTDINVNLNETNLNDNGPIFTPVNPGDSEYTFSYSENTDAGATIATVAATDLDGDTITYSIKTNETNQAGDALFAIDATTGEISLTAAGEASFADDYELGDNLNDIIVTASDGVHNTDINVNLNETNLNDNGPIFTPVNPGDSEYTFSYSENTDAGATIATVAATDLDGDTITYSIKTNETNQAGDALFAIDATTGEISLTAAGEASFADDYELGDNLNDIIVTASDGVHNTDINVNLNETNLNEAPIATDDGEIITTKMGLVGEYFGIGVEDSGDDDNYLIDNIQDFRTMIASKTPDATFVGGNIFYGNSSNANDLSQDKHLEGFLGSDSSSLRWIDDSNHEEGGIHLTGSVYLEAGEYSFKVLGDDGYQIMINGAQVAAVDANQPPTSDAFDPFTIPESGYYPVDIVYWDQGGNYVFQPEFSKDGGNYQYLDASILIQETDTSSLFATSSDTDLVIDSTELLSNDTDVDGDTLAITGVTNATNGTVSFDPVTGKVTFTPTAGYTGEASFTYTIADEHGLAGIDGGDGTASATVTLYVHGSSAVADGTPVISVADNEVLEEGLTDGDDNSGSEFTTGAFSISSLDGISALNVEGRELTSNQLNALTQNSSSSHVSIDTDKGEITLTNYNSSTGEISYEYKLNSSQNHSNGDVKDNISISVTDNDGDITNSGFDINIVDDAPSSTGTTHNLEVNITPITTNLVVMLDKSGSMDGNRMDIAKAAIADLINTYDDLGSVNVKLITFDSNAYENNWSSDLNDVILKINGTQAVGATDYDDPLRALKDNYGSASDPTPTADQSFVYFLSDGVPNTDTYKNEIAKYQSTWENFVTGKFDKVYAVGVGSNIDETYLDMVSFPNTNNNENTLVITDESALSDKLLATISGVVIGDATASNIVGADGGTFTSFSVDGVTYTNNGDSIVHNVSGDKGVLTVDFSDGSYKYVANPLANDKEDYSLFFTASVTDADGDIANPVFTINVDFKDSSVITPVIDPTIPPVASIEMIDKIASDGEINDILVCNVSLDKAVDVDTVVKFSLTGTSTEGDDFEPISYEVVVLAHQTSSAFSIEIHQDTTVESTENITLTLEENPSSNYTISDTNGDASGIIVDDESVVFDINSLGENEVFNFSSLVDSGKEVFNMTNDKSETINVNEILDNNTSTTLDKTLTILGDEDDKVDIDTGEWTKLDTQTQEGFDDYVSSQDPTVTLKIEDDLNVGNF
nr:cadherin-like domain-containing protein [uncultured Sulfurimonas sp.]